MRGNSLIHRDTHVFILYTNQSRLHIKSPRERKPTCMNRNIVIVCDFNIDWLNTNGSERKRFYIILETFGFVQNICTGTHRSHHLLDYNIVNNIIITRKDCNIISDCTVSDFISDHRVLTSCFSTMYTPPSSSKTDNGQSIVYETVIIC